MTFAQRPLLTSPEQLDSWQPDVAVVGAPFDLGTSNRPGARFGPRALRSNAYESGTYHLSYGLEIFEHVEVVDYGDAHCPHGMVQQSLDNIKSRVHDVASRRIIPFTMGGDHTITWPAATAVADVYGYGNVGMVHFDAHADTADSIDGNLASHGTPMRRLIDSGAIPGRNFIQIGLRSYWPGQDVWDWMAEQGMRWHLMDEIWERGFQAVMADAVREALDGPELLYISVDIDSLDPAYAPATGTPEPGGIVAADLMRMVRSLAYQHTHRRHGRRRGGARVRPRRLHRQRRQPSLHGVPRRARRQAPRRRRRYAWSARSLIGPPIYSRTHDTTDWRTTGDGRRTGPTGPTGRPCRGTGRRAADREPQLLGRHRVG